MAESLTRFTKINDGFADAARARRNFKNLRRLTGSPEVLREEQNRNRVNVNGDSGPNLAQFRASVDAAGIRRLLGQMALFLHN